MQAFKHFHTFYYPTLRQHYLQKAIAWPLRRRGCELQFRGWNAYACFAVRGACPRSYHYVVYHLACGEDSVELLNCSSFSATAGKCRISVNQQVSVEMQSSRCINSVVLVRELKVWGEKIKLETAFAYLNVSAGGYSDEAKLMNELTLVIKSQQSEEDCFRKDSRHCQHQCWA